ncbi:MAG: hypothetical protein RIQ59_793 [Bacteroidota bacterium]|jgi:hypothetical protein
MKIKNSQSAIGFEENGFFVINNFFDNQTVLEIADFYASFQFKKSPELNTNIKSCSNEQNYLISDFLKSKFESKIPEFFEEYQLGGGVFIMKGSGEESVSSLHQDFNVVDERRFTSLTIWVPLIDVDESNGCIQIVAGSHKWFNSVRSFNMPSFFLDFNLVADRLTAVPLRRGDAVVFNHSVFHGSKPNYSSNYRPAASFSLISSGAIPIHYIKHEDQVFICQTDKDFYNEKAKMLFSGEIPDDLNIVNKIPFEENMIITKDKMTKYLSQKTDFKSRLKSFVSIFKK